MTARHRAQPQHPPCRTFWHCTPQNHTVWHLLHFIRFSVSPQLAAGRWERAEHYQAEGRRRKDMLRRGGSGSLPPTTALTALHRVRLLGLVHGCHSREGLRRWLSRFARSKRDELSRSHWRADAGLDTAHTMRSSDTAAWSAEARVAFLLWCAVPVPRPWLAALCSLTVLLGRCSCT